MAFNEREELILEYLRAHKEATVEELCRAFFVSESTVRRDLTALALAKRIIRTHGGACYKSTQGENLPQEIRERENAEKKEKIAKKCLQLINDGDTLMVDASSTAIPLLNSLSTKRSLVLITNSVKAPLILAGTDVKVLISGGELATTTYGLVGGYAESFIGSFNADICFISVTSLSKDGMLTDNSIAENLVRRIMLSRSKKKALMLDSTKIGGPCISNLCNLDVFDYVICDTDLSDLFPNYRGKFI